MNLNKLNNPLTSFALLSATQLNMDEFVLLKCFHNNGEDFSGYYQAQNYCKSRGWSYGPTQKGAPVAVYADNSIVSKWRNLSQEDKKQMHGFIFSTDLRNGNVILCVKRGKQSC